MLECVGFVTSCVLLELEAIAPDVCVLRWRCWKTNLRSSWRNPSPILGQQPARCFLYCTDLLAIFGSAVSFWPLARSHEYLCIFAEFFLGQDCKRVLEDLHRHEELKFVDVYCCFCLTRLHFPLAVMTVVGFLETRTVSSSAESSSAWALMLPNPPQIIFPQVSSKMVLVSDQTSAWREERGLCPCCKVSSCVLSSTFWRHKGMLLCWALRPCCKVSSCVLSSNFGAQRLRSLRFTFSKQQLAKDPFFPWTFTVCCKRAFWEANGAIWMRNPNVSTYSIRQNRLGFRRLQNPGRTLRRHLAYKVWRLPLEFPTFSLSFTTGFFELFVMGQIIWVICFSTLPRITELFDEFCDSPKWCFSFRWGTLDILDHVNYRATNNQVWYSCLETNCRRSLFDHTPSFRTVFHSILWTSFRRSSVHDSIKLSISRSMFQDDHRLRAFLQHVQLSYVSETASASVFFRGLGNVSLLSARQTLNSRFIVWWLDQMMSLMNRPAVSRGFSRHLLFPDRFISVSPWPWFSSEIFWPLTGLVPAFKWSSTESRGLFLHNFARMLSSG